MFVEISLEMEILVLNKLSSPNKMEKVKLLFLVCSIYVLNRKQICKLLLRQKKFFIKKLIYRCILIKVLVISLVDLLRSLKFFNSFS